MNKYKLRRFFKKIPCWIGLHKWKYATMPKNNYPRRCCDNCNLWQDGIYDMSTGDTLWETDR